MASLHFSARRSQDFPQVHVTPLLIRDSWVERQIARVDRLFTVYDFQPMNCAFELPDWDIACGDPAVVSDLETEKPLCAKHARRVEMDRGLAAQLALVVAVTIFVHVADCFRKEW